MAATTKIPSMDSLLDNRPIGVFDSGIGGLTVVREIQRQLPWESLVYFGDTSRCPYGPRPLAEIRQFALQITQWLLDQRVKLIVVACNSATAAALPDIQALASVPVIGVVDPGARAAVAATTNQKVGVIGTSATIDSGVYSQAIRALDPAITVFSAATPRFVEMVEAGLRLDRNPLETFMAPVNAIYVRPAFQEIARDYLEPLRRCGIDTLVLGCTHYPLLTPLITSIIGPAVQIISSATETAHDVRATLTERGELAGESARVQQRFATTGWDLAEFQALGSAILGQALPQPESVSLATLAAFQQFVRA